MHVLKFRYALGKDERPLELKVNGEIVEQELSFPTTGSWNDWKTISVETELKAEENTVRLAAIGSSGSNIDCLIVD